MLEKYKDLLTVKDLAEILRVSENRVYDLIEKGRIKTHRFGRDYKCPKAWLIERYLTAGSVEG
jgi:excisionase family DNA binding protein